MLVMKTRITFSKTAEHGRGGKRRLVANELLEDNLNKKVHIKSDKLDQVLNDFMINAFNAANQELLNKNK